MPNTYWFSFNIQNCTCKYPRVFASNLAKHHRNKRFLSLLINLVTNCLHDRMSFASDVRHSVYDFMQMKNFLAYDVIFRHRVSENHERKSTRFHIYGRQKLFKRV